MAKRFFKETIFRMQPRILLYSVLAFVIAQIALRTLSPAVFLGSIGLGLIVLSAWHIKRYLRVHDWAFATLYPERDQADKIRAAISVRYRHAPSLLVYLFSIGGVLICLWGLGVAFVQSIFSGFATALLGIGLILASIASRIRIIGPPAMVFLGLSESSQSVYRQMSFICAPFPCWSLMRHSKRSTPGIPAVAVFKTRQDSFRTNTDCWLQVVSQCVDSVHLTVVDARELTDHLMDELVTICSDSKNTDVIYIVHDDGSSPLLAEYQRRTGNSLGDGPGIRLTLPRALRLARYVTRGALAQRSAHDKLRDKAFLALHDGLWSSMDTLILVDHGRLNSICSKNGIFKYTLDENEYAQWIQPDYVSRVKWRKHCLDGIAGNAARNGKACFLVADSDSNFLFRGITSLFEGDHYGSTPATSW